MKKLLAVLMTALLLCSSFAIFPASAEGEKFIMMPHKSPDGADGGWYASGGVSASEAYGDEGIDITATFRTLWAIPDSIANKYPYLYIQIESGIENLTRFTATHMWHSGEHNQKDIDYTAADGQVLCVNLFELLKGEDSPVGYLYITPYIEGRVVFSKFYLSNTDPDGNVYVPPTQPIPMWSTGKPLRYDLPAYADGDHVEDVDGKLFGWMMVQPNGTIPVQITENEDGKGFYMERKEGFESVTAANIAYVVPYEQLEKTPYLIVDISNEGRPDEGPQVDIYAYWESVEGSLARFDGVDGWTGANGMNGVRAYNLKYAVDNVKEQLHGENGIAIIVALNWAGERTDGTCMETLKIEDMYLAGWEGGEDSTESFQDHFNHPTTATTATTAADNGAEGGEFPILPVAIAAAAVIVIAAVAVIVIKKKK